MYSLWQRSGQWCQAYIVNDARHTLSECDASFHDFRSQCRWLCIVQRLKQLNKFLNCQLAVMVLLKSKRSMRKKYSNKPDESLNRIKSHTYRLEQKRISVSSFVYRNWQNQQGAINSPTIIKYITLTICKRKDTIWW